MAFLAGQDRHQIEGGGLTAVRRRASTMPHSSAYDLTRFLHTQALPNPLEEVSLILPSAAETDMGPSHGRR
jgi:hypothetical protein